MKRVFISRNLKKDSIFLERLKPPGFVVDGISLIRFELIPFEQFPSSDWIFFYSAKAVHFFFKQLNILNLKLDKEVRLAVMGKGTAKALDRMPDFIGSGVPSLVAKSFLQKANGQRVVFPRAKHSKQSIQKLLEGRLEMLDLVVYDNQIRSIIPILEHDVLVFTSPMNVQAYFQQYKLREYQKIVSIGQTTAKALKERGIEVHVIASNASEEALADAVIELSS